MSTGNHKLATFRRWAQSADYNAVFVYFRTPLQRDSEVFDYARKLHEAGLVFLCQRKTDAGEFEYCARRTTPKVHHVLDKVSRSLAVRVREDRDGPGRRKLVIPELKEAA